MLRMQEMTFPGFKFQKFSGAWYIGHTRGFQPLLSPSNILSHRKVPFQKMPPHWKILKKGPALYSLSMRRNQVKSAISRTSTHHRRMKNIRMLKETKSQVNNLIFSPTGFDHRNIRADRTSELCRLRSNYDFSV